MKRISTAVFPLALVALLAALSFWLERATNPSDPARKAEKRHDPDFIIEQVDVRHFDAGGGLKQGLLADKLTHYPDDDSTQVAKPRLTYYMGQQITRLTSNDALVSQDNKRVLMRGNVHLIKPPLADRPETVLRTEMLTVFPDDDIAQSNVRVTITRGESVVSGDGIRYDGRASIAVLAGRVKGTFYRVKKS